MVKKKKNSAPETGAPRKPGPSRKSKAGKGAVPEWQQNDPQYQSEVLRYEDPIPSREMIIKALAEGPKTLDDLIGEFALARLSQQSAIEKRLLAMVRDGQIVQNRRGAFGPVSRMNLIAGVIQAHRDGFGFLIPDEGGADIYLPPRQMRSVINGDRALVRVMESDERGRPQGSVVEVIERASRLIVGRLHVDQGICYVIPENPKVHQELLIPPDQRAEGEHGQMVVAEILAPPSARTLAIGRVVEILGEHLAPGMEIVASIRANGIPTEWPPELQKELARIPDQVQPAQIEGRVDLRELPLVTIDGADARDFDDAVHAKAMRGGGWTLWVAIADVSAYVQPGTALDREAANRGTSVYFPQQVIPMLPEKLSNGLCSLNPDVDRLCMVCEMRVSAEGEVLKSRFYEAVMCSKARLIYDDVAHWLEHGEKSMPEHRRPLWPHIKALDGLFEAFFAARERRGAIDFESSETRIIFDDARKISQIVPVTRNKAHRIIEECMVAANVQAARKAAASKLPAPYRVHERPELMKIESLREFLQAQGMKLGGGDRPEAADYAALMNRARKRPDASLIQTVLLRSLMQARYSPDNVGHFGLALEYYGHFTSPIRRYPDLLLHRALKHAILRRTAKTFIYSTDDLDRYCTHCSMAERRADDATRDVVQWLKCEFMSQHVGELHEGVVTGVAPFGLFVEVKGFHVDGLVHVSQLQNDYYQFDALHHRLQGERSGKSYGLGDGMRIRIVRVNLDERKIDLEPVNGNDDPRPPRKTPKRSSAKRRS